MARQGGWIAPRGILESTWTNHAHDPSDWWRTFFTGAPVDFWLRVPNPEQTAREVEYVRGELGARPGARLLDVPCGGGRHALALAQQGFHVSGVDISADFLAAARAGVVEGSGSVDWSERPMTELPWRDTFDGAYCLGNSFPYLDDAGNAAFPRAVAAALRPGGRFVLETSYVAEVVLPSLQERAWYPMGDLHMLAQREYDPVEGRLHVEYLWVREGRIDRTPMSARIYTYRELLALIERSGLRVVKAVAGFGGEPFRLGSPRLVVTAERASA